MWAGGGILGATLITSAVIGLPSLGAVAFTGIFISTQLVVATIFDSTGAFGFAVVPVTARRVCGVLVAVLAAAAFQQPPPASLPWMHTWKTRIPASPEEEKPLVSSTKSDEMNEETKTRESLQGFRYFL
jgi:hypothetical protein